MAWFNWRSDDDSIRIEKCCQSHIINKVDVFDVHLICYHITINISGCLLSNLSSKHDYDTISQFLYFKITLRVRLWNTSYRLIKSPTNREEQWSNLLLCGTQNHPIIGSMSKARCVASACSCLFLNINTNILLAEYQ